MSAEAERRWRLILGPDERDDPGAGLSGDDAALDRCLTQLYRGESEGGGKKGGLGKSSPSVARWLGDVRKHFPTDVVRVMQKDAFSRLGIERMLVEPELLEAVEPDVHLVATLVSLKGVVPARSKAAARQVVDRVVTELLRRLEQPLRQAVQGSLDRAARTRRPRSTEIDWPRTILANLKHYQPEHRTVIPERLVGYGRRRASMRDLILLVDQSGSMATSVVYAGVFAAVLAKLPALRTSLVAFDTAVADLTEQLDDDPVDLLFGLQLGGGTDIARALRYAEQRVERPEDTVLVLISDLYEGGDRDELAATAQRLAARGVRMVVLLALDDDGSPWFDHGVAELFSGLGAPAFACTPHRFPELMAEALARRDVGSWASRNGIVTAAHPERMETQT